MSPKALVKAMKKPLDIFDHILNIVAFLAGTILIFIMVSVCLDVILRYFFNRPLIWVTQVTECLLLYITFLGSAWLLREEGHVKVDMLINHLGPKTVALLGIISSTIGIAVSVVLTVFGSSLSWYYFRTGLYTPTILQIPIFAIIVIIPVGSLMLLLQFIRRTFKFIAGFIIEKGKSGS